MGWASGSVVMDGVIKAVKKEVPNKATRKRIYAKVINVLRDQDWDTMDESLGEDQVYDDLYNELFSDEEE